MDVTHIPCSRDGWGYLVAVIDCHDREIVAYEFALRGRDSQPTDIGGEDWQRVQRILDRGEWLERPRGRRLLWVAEASKPWAAVVKRTRSGEIYLQSYRRANRRDVAKLEGR